MQEWAGGDPSLLPAPPPARGLGDHVPPSPEPPSTQIAANTPEPSVHRSRPSGLAESPRETAQTLVKGLNSSRCVQCPGCCWARMCLQELKGTGISWGQRGKRPSKESSGGRWQRTGKVCLSREDGLGCARWIQVSGAEIKSPGGLQQSRLIWSTPEHSSGGRGVLDEQGGLPQPVGPASSEGPRARLKESRSGLSWPLTTRTQVWPGSEGSEGKMGGRG